MMSFENKISEPPSTFLRNVYVDTATSSLPNHLANLELMGADHLLFGTDSPPLATPLEDAIAMVEKLPVPDRSAGRSSRETPVASSASGRSCQVLAGRQHPKQARFGVLRRLTGSRITEIVSGSASSPGPPMIHPWMLTSSRHIACACPD